MWVVNMLVNLKHVWTIVSRFAVKLEIHDLYYTLKDYVFKVFTNQSVISFLMHEHIMMQMEKRFKLWKKYFVKLKYSIQTLKAS